MEVVVEARDLVKRFGTLTAVAGISFEVRPRECLGFLGPNGAGKTSTLKMVYGFSPLTSGTITVFGLSIEACAREIRRRVGIVPQENNLDPDLTVIQNLKIYARYFDLSRKETEQRAGELLDFFHLKEKRTSGIEKLSGGMKRRLLIARALINRPELLILDEPTTGLDPQSRHVMWERIHALRDQGVTTILTTHYMEEAARLCDRVLVVDHGRIIEEGRPDRLVAQHGAANLEEVFLKLTGRELRD